MAIDTDLQVNAGGDIRYVGSAHGAAGAGYYTAIEFHRWLSRKVAQLTPSGDDYLDITRKTPSNRSTDNIITLLAPYNVDQTLIEHLYDGSIIQSGGAEIYDGFLVYAQPGMDLQVVQAGALVANDFWNSTPNGASTSGLNANAANGISHRFLLKTRSAGADIDGRRVLGQTRVWGKTYSEFRVNGTARGNNVLALNYTNDLNNETSLATVAGWATINNATAGYKLLDVNNDGVNEPYYSEWDIADHTINDFYERAKWLTRVGSASTLYGLNGELFRGITHEIPVDTPTGTFAAFEAISWSGGTGQMLARDSGSAPTKLWMQLLTGLPPSDNQVLTGATSAATCQVNGSPIDRPVSFPFVGASTGAALIGAYGLGLQVFDLSASDKVFDLAGNQRTPPNYVTYTVNGCVSGEDAVLVGPATVGGELDEQQFTLAASYSGAVVTSLQMTANIPSDTPAAGTLRVEVAPWLFVPVEYTNYSGDTFTIVPTNFSANAAEAGNGAYVAYIDTLVSSASVAFTTVFLADRQLYIRVRDGGAVGESPTKTYETTGLLGPAGGSTTIIRTSDA